MAAASSYTAKGRTPVGPAFQPKNRATGEVDDDGLTQAARHRAAPLNLHFEKGSGNEELLGPEGYPILVREEVPNGEAKVIPQARGSLEGDDSAAFLQERPELRHGGSGRSRFPADPGTPPEWSRGLGLLPLHHTSAPHPPAWVKG